MKSKSLALGFPEPHMRDRNRQRMKRGARRVTELVDGSVVCSSRALHNGKFLARDRAEFDSSRNRERAGARQRNKVSLLLGAGHRQIASESLRFVVRGNRSSRRTRLVEDVPALQERRCHKKICERKLR